MVMTWQDSPPPAFRLDPYSDCVLLFIHHEGPTTTRQIANLVYWLSVYGCADEQLGLPLGKGE